MGRRMKMTVREKTTKDCLGIVEGKDLEECLAEAVKTTRMAVDEVKSYPHEVVVYMKRRYRNV